MDSMGLHPIEVYIKRRQKTISERLACQPVYALCTDAEIMLGTSWMMIWWDQDMVNEP